MDYEEYKQLREQGISKEEIQQKYQPEGERGLKGFARGVAMGELGTAKGILNLSSKFGRGILGGVEKVTGLPVTPEPTVWEKPKPEWMKPKSMAEKIGYGTEQIAEFLVPSSKIAKFEKGMGLAGRAVTEAVTFGGITAVQEGRVGEEARNAAILGAAFPLVGAGYRGAKELAGRGITRIGEKISQTIIRPLEKEVKSGFLIKNMTKHGVHGSPSRVISKTASLMNQSTDALEKVLLKTVEKQNIKIDLQEVANQTVKKFLFRQKTVLKGFGSTKARTQAVDDLFAEIKQFGKYYGTTKANLYEANFIKRGVGTKGAWAYGMPDRQASALHEVYTAYYSGLKHAIEKGAKGAGKEIKQLNKTISELLPIHRAAIKRLPVAARNNILSLTDSIGLYASAFDPKALTIIGVKKLSTSGTFARALVAAGEWLKKTEAKTSLGKRFVGQ